MRVKWLWGAKDGGPESKVYVWGLEIKSLFSVLLLKFERGSREAYHSHAFNALSWLVKGGLLEVFHPQLQREGRRYRPSLRPIKTRREDFHQVFGEAKATWVISFRGPWRPCWMDFVESRGFVVLTHGRKEVTP